MLVFGGGEKPKHSGKPIAWNEVYASNLLNPHGIMTLNLRSLSAKTHRAFRFNR